MGTLQVSQGGTVGTRHPITQDSTRLGRDPSNDVVVDVISVSRHHARIILEGEDYYIEDLKSRNGTVVNGQALTARHKLSDGDEIEICEMCFRFFVGEPPPVGVTELADRSTGIPASDLDSGRLTPGSYVNEDSSSTGSGLSSIVTTLQAGDSNRGLRLGIKPEAKLRAVVKILRALRQSMTLDDVLHSILDGLFEIFPQCQQGFIMLHDQQRDRLRLEATRVRTRKQAEVKVSMTIVQHAIETGEAILSADAGDDSRFNQSESIQSLGIRSIMCVPLLSQDDVRLGVIQIDTSNLVDQFSQEDLDIMLAVGTPVSLAITNARFIAKEIESKALARELDFAREIQQGYLPKSMPHAPGFDIAHYYESAEQIGGDYFDCFGIKDGRVCLAIGDVAGKGVPAALLMSRLYSAVRTQMLVCSDPATTMKLVNDEFTFDQSVFRFITLMIVIIDPATGSLDIVNAGHSPLLMCSQGGEIELLGIRAGGMPIGVLPDQEFAITEASIPVGARFAVYSDGFTESVGKNRELFGRKRLAKILGDNDLPAQDIIGKVVSAVEAFRNGQPQEDDSCLAVVRRLST